jgi:uncharacterized membrane protein YkvA (DUF1232 family)
VWPAWQARARQLKHLTYALYLAYRDPRTPWPARIVAMVAVGYASSPIDLIPDVIPVLGIRDDLVLVPLGIPPAIRVMPGVVWHDARIATAAPIDGGKPVNWVAAGVIVALWIVLAPRSVLLIYRLVR